jgi:hypothetical protein
MDCKFTIPFAFTPCREALNLPPVPAAPAHQDDGSKDVGMVNPFTKEGSAGVYNWVAGSLGTKKITFDEEGETVYPKTDKEDAEEAEQMRTAAALFNMAFVLRQQGKYEESLKLYERCFRIRYCTLLDTECGAMRAMRVQAYLRWVWTMIRLIAVMIRYLGITVIRPVYTIVLLIQICCLSEAFNRTCPWCIENGECSEESRVEWSEEQIFVML